MSYKLSTHLSSRGRGVSRRGGIIIIMTPISELPLGVEALYDAADNQQGSKSSWQACFDDSFSKCNYWACPKLACLVKYVPGVQFNRHEFWAQKWMKNWDNFWASFSTRHYKFRHGLKLQTLFGTESGCKMSIELILYLLSILLYLALHVSCSTKSRCQYITVSSVPSYESQHMLWGMHAREKMVYNLLLLASPGTHTA